MMLISLSFNSLDISKCKRFKVNMLSFGTLNIFITGDEDDSVVNQAFHVSALV